MSSRSIHLKTQIPGPLSQALMARRKKAVALGPFHSTSIFAHKAEGAHIWDVDGNCLLDFSCGIGVTNIGHSPARVVEAVRNQAERFLHTSFNIVPYESYIELSEKLNAMVRKSIGASFEMKTFLANSGAEAVENSIKIARSFTHRSAVVCFDHAFHGRTYMAMSLTSKAKPYKYGFGPLASEIYRAPFPNEYRDGKDENHCFQKFEDLVINQIGAASTAAVIVEPVLGEGGFLPMPSSFFQKVQKFCNANGIVLIADEIQSGFGRTGTLTACEQLGVTPDLITFAKGLAAGMPLSAVVGKAEIMDAVGEGGIGGTYGGNPVAIAASLEVLKTMQDSRFLEHTKKVGAEIISKTRQWAKEYPIIGNVRGLGPMQGIEIVSSQKTKEPSKELTGKVLKSCLDKGLIVLSCGTYGNVIRLLVPLILSSEELNEGLAILEESIRAHSS